MQATGVKPASRAMPRGGVAPRSARRAGLCAGVIALHLLALWAFIAAGPLPLRRGTAEPVMTWLSLPDVSTRRAPTPRANARPVTVLPVVPIVPVSPDIPRATAITPQVVPDHKPSIDWGAAAVDAARHHLEQQADDQRRNHAMGSSPDATARAPQPHQAFPWGHQPLSKHLDRQGAVVTLNTKHCTVAFLLFVPFGFGCAPGSIPEPGQGDLFDPKYAPPPLELPKPLVDDPVRR